MFYCSEFRKFCEDELECLDCYDHIGTLNRKQYKYELKKKEQERIEKWIQSKQPLKLESRK
jgi:hypothetical protein